MSIDFAKEKKLSCLRLLGKKVPRREGEVIKYPKVQFDDAHF